MPYQHDALLLWMEEALYELEGVSTRRKIAVNLETSFAIPQLGHGGNDFGSLQCANKGAREDRKRRLVEL
jgi:hypothetical protein